MNHRRPQATPRPARRTTRAVVLAWLATLLLATLVISGVNPTEAQAAPNTGCGVDPEVSARITWPRPFGPVTGKDGTTPEMAFDGDADTFFRSDHGNWQHLEIDLGCVQTFTGLSRLMSRNGATSGHRGAQGEGISFSVDGRTWTDVTADASSGWETFTAYRSSAWHSVDYGWSPTLTLDTPAAARYVRFRWDGNNDDLNEVRIDSRPLSCQGQPGGIDQPCIIKQQIGFPIELEMNCVGTRSVACDAVFSGLPANWSLASFRWEIRPQWPPGATARTHGRGTFSRLEAGRFFGEVTGVCDGCIVYRGKLTAVFESPDLPPNDRLGGRRATELNAESSDSGVNRSVSLTCDPEPVDCVARATGDIEDFRWRVERAIFVETSRSDNQSRIEGACAPDLITYDVTVIAVFSDGATREAAQTFACPRLPPTTSVDVECQGDVVDCVATATPDGLVDIGWRFHSVGGSISHRPPHVPRLGVSEVSPTCDGHRVLNFTATVTARYDFNGDGTIDHEETAETRGICRCELP